VSSKTQKTSRCLSHAPHSNASASPHRAARTPPPAFLSLSLKPVKEQRDKQKHPTSQSRIRARRLKKEAAAPARASPEAPVQNRDEPDISSSQSHVNPNPEEFLIRSRPFCGRRSPFQPKLDTGAPHVQGSSDAGHIGGGVDGRLIGPPDSACQQDSPVSSATATVALVLGTVTTPQSRHTPPRTTGSRQVCGSPACICVGQTCRAWSGTSPARTAGLLSASDPSNRHPPRA
jgi:hypothetical protein